MTDLTLSSLQERLWFLDQLEPENPADHLAAAYRFTGELDTVALGRSVNEIARRHESLRMSFPSIAGKPKLTIQPKLHLGVKRVDLRCLPPRRREESARTQAVDEARLPFDLGEGPLLRVCLWQLSEEDYILLVVMHSTVSDDRSMEIFLQELSKIYSAFAEKRPCSLPELQRQYVDFLQSQRQVMDSQDHEVSLAYWRKHLADCPEALSLATDHPRSPNRTYRAGRHVVVLSRSLSVALDRFCQKESTSLFDLFLAAFGTLLYRYADEGDIVVGVALDGRAGAGLESVIGPFARTLPLRSDLSGEPSFLQHLARVRQTVSSSFFNQDISFARLLKEIQPARDLSREPLFQVRFRVRPSSSGCTVLPAVRIESLEFDIGLSRYDLTLELVQRAEEVECHFDYSRDLFETATIARLAEHFQTLLQSIASTPQRAISDLPMLTEAERLHLLGLRNEPKTDNEEALFSHEMFQAQAARTPKSIAIVTEGETLTYGELNHRANQLAHYLQDLGIRPEISVGLCLERSLSLVVAVLAVLKAGGGYLPLDPALPEDRLAFMVATAKSPVILTEQRFADKLSRLAVRVVTLDANNDILNHCGKDSLVSGLIAGNLGQIFFTSGSAGDPKAVMWNQRKQSRHHQWARMTFGLTENDRYLMKTAISFTPLGLEIFWPLLTGAQLIIAPPGIEQDSMALVRLMEQHRITVINFVPSMLRVILEEAEVERCTSLRQVICFGEAVSAELVDRFFSRLSSDLSVIYGATEAPSATFRKCKRKDPCQSFNIGKVLSHKQVYILNSKRELVPIGVPGEIYIGGEMLARGYLNRPDLTAERFLPNQFSHTPGARMYQTGDRARYLSDGSLEFLGRTDQQVKIRGFRIEPREVETTLEQNPMVQQAVILAREDERGEKRLVAYVVPRQVSSLSVSNLRQFAKQRLPDYMIPSVFVLLENLPLTSNGKVNRKALPPPDWNPPESEISYIPPRSPVEQSLVAIWADILKREKVGIRDNFFELGGDSLLATQLMSRVRKTFQAEIPLRVLFEDPFVEALAIAIVDSLAANVSDLRQTRE